MALAIKMCRFESVPWGFRLVGGTDFEIPLTVVKVAEGSIAEEAGLKVNDIILRINDIDATILEHEEAHQIINHFGNVFYFDVYRENYESVEIKKFPILDPHGSDSISRSPTTDLLFEERYMQPIEIPCTPPRESISNDELVSNESKILDENSNIKGLSPNPGVCMCSDTLALLNEAEIDKNDKNKKWTTFLQKPNRPIPKCKPIKPKIISTNKEIPKQIQKSLDESVLEVIKTEDEEVQKIQQTEEALKEKEVEAEKEIEAESEILNAQDTENVSESVQTEQMPPSNTGEDLSKTNSELENVILNDNENTLEEQESEAKIITTENVVNDVEYEPQLVRDNPTKDKVNSQKSEEVIDLETQLADVQKQLAALSGLPTTIQATLDAVTKHLAQLLPALEEQQHLESVVEEDTTSLKNNEITKEQLKEDNEGNANEKDTDELHLDPTTDSTVEFQANIEQIQEIDIEQRQIQIEEETQIIHEEYEIKKKGCEVIGELGEHWERKNNATNRRSKQTTGPLTPSSDRPVVLPGGRRWYRPKDAYNDEFIAETLSAQAELITGTTLGVNFKKFQKPERRIDLNKSEVYKVIHHLDKQPIRGIEVRPPKIPAEIDIRNAVETQAN